MTKLKFSEKHVWKMYFGEFIDLFETYKEIFDREKIYLYKAKEEEEVGVEVKESLMDL